MRRETGNRCVRLLEPFSIGAEVGVHVIRAESPCECVGTETTLRESSLHESIDEIQVDHGLVLKECIPNQVELVRSAEREQPCVEGFFKCHECML